MDCLSTLPVEILHRIFDGLDVSTIVLSLRITCQRLKAIIDNYDRYALDFRSISRSNFQLLCRLIHPRKVTSLTLAPMEETLDQIELFMSSFRARQFNRLRSLTLINIKENQLKDVLKRFQFTSLTSFSFTLGPRDDRRKNTTATLISSVIAKANLHYLDLDVHLYRVEKIIWPAQCTIRYLTIGYCDEFDSILTILRCSSHLQTLIIKFSYSVNETITRQNSSSTYFHQITSLTLENLRTNIENLEFLLSLMPALIHLKLIVSGHFMDGNRWEQFIQTNLPCLNQFELFVKETQNAATSVDIKSILTSFQTPFWLEHKKWFFTCEYVALWPEHFKLYSIPICMTSLTYEPESKKTVLSTFNPIINNNMSIMDNVTTIKLTASQFSLNDINQRVEVSVNIIFLSLLFYVKEIILIRNSIYLIDSPYLTGNLSQFVFKEFEYRFSLQPTYIILMLFHSRRIFERIVLKSFIYFYLHDRAKIRISLTIFLSFFIESNVRQSLVSQNNHART
jgi:hypothetical protein